jgi:hypothetical protein
MEAFDERAIVSTADPIDPTNCPTCRSGSPPRDEYYEAAIGV